MAKKLIKKKKETKQINKNATPNSIKKKREREKKNLTEDMQDQYTENKKTFLRDKLKAISRSQFGSSQ